MLAKIVTTEELRQRYLEDAIATATPAVRLTMLFDRMVLDLRRADEGFDSSDWKLVNDNLVHVQEILLALRDTLRTDTWGAGSDVAKLYTFLHAELLAANIGKERERARKAAEMIEQLAEAWRRAAENVATEAGPGVVGGVA
jgi:flagellar protein FliS